MQFHFKEFDKVTEEIGFHNSSNFTSGTSDSFPAREINAGPEKKHDLRICDYSGPKGQRGVVIADNQHKYLQWKIYANSTPGSNHIFRCIEERLGYFVSRECHGVDGLQWRKLDT